jgi:myosin heavy subunit
MSANTISCDPSASNSNVRKFEAFENALRTLEFGDEGMKTIRNILAAILVLGELRFRDGGDGKAEIENPKIASSGKNSGNNVFY